MRNRFDVSATVLVISLLACAAVRAQDPNSSEADVLGRIKMLNPHLSVHDPRELPMKLRAVLQDEYTFSRGTADSFYAYCRKHCPESTTRRAGTGATSGGAYPQSFGGP